MTNQTQLFNTKNLIVAITLFLCFSVLFVINSNGESRKRLYSVSAMKAKKVVATNLESKLKSDLYNSNIKVLVRNVEDYKVVDNKIIMKGDGFCVLTKSNAKMPLKFETVINTQDNDASEVKYNFVDFEERSAYAPSVNEDNLMTALLNRLSKDYLTTDVVIAIDDAKGIKQSSSKKAYVGYGEVKVKNGEWKRVEFSVELNTDNSTAKNIVYKLK